MLIIISSSKFSAFNVGVKQKQNKQKIKGEHLTLDWIHLIPSSHGHLQDLQKQTLNRDSETLILTWPMSHFSLKGIKSHLHGPGIVDTDRFLRHSHQSYALFIAGTSFLSDSEMESVTLLHYKGTRFLNSHFFLLSTVQVTISFKSFLSGPFRSISLNFSLCSLAHSLSLGGCMWSVVYILSCALRKQGANGAHNHSVSVLAAAMVVNVFFSLHHTPLVPTASSTTLQVTFNGLPSPYLGMPGLQIKIQDNQSNLNFK